MSQKGHIPGWNFSLKSNATFTLSKVVISGKHGGYVYTLHLRPVMTIAAAVYRGEAGVTVTNYQRL